MSCFNIITLTATDMPCFNTITLTATDMPYFNTITLTATDMPYFNIITLTATDMPYFNIITLTATDMPYFNIILPGIYLQAQQVRQFTKRVVVQLPQFVPRQIPAVDSVTSSCSDVEGKWRYSRLTRFIDNPILFGS
jgi:hypothetical protein